MTVLGQERAVVVGAGSLGTVYGAALARAGLDVQLLAREEHARAIQARGAVTVDSFGEQWEVRLRADWRPERIEPAEIVIVLTKTPDTASCARGPRLSCRASFGSPPPSRTGSPRTTSSPPGAARRPSSARLRWWAGRCRRPAACGTR